MSGVLKTFSSHIKKYFETENHYSEFIFIPFFLGLLFLSAFLQQINFSVTDFSQHSISFATASNIDIGKRVALFYQSLGILAGTFLILVPLIIYLRKVFFSDDEIKILNTTSLAGCVLFFFQLIGGDFSQSFHLIFSLQFLAIVFAAIRKILKSNSEGESFLTIFCWFICLAFSFYFFEQIVFHLLGIEVFISLPKFLILFSSVLLFVFYRAQINNQRELFLRIIYSAKEFIWLPMLSFACAESYMITNQRGYFHFNPYLIYFLLLALLMLKVFFNLGKSKKGFSATTVESLGKTLHNFLFPVLVFSMVVLANYKTVVQMPVDSFEDANKVLPVQQFYEFGRIPFVHNFSAHALNDFFFGFLYSFLNGYNAFGGTIYQFLLYPFIVLFIYFAVKEISNVWLALFIALLYPFAGFVFPPYYNLVLLSVFALLNVLRKQTFRNYFLFFLLLFFMPVWRVDLGLANFFALLGSFLLVAFFKNNFKVERKFLLKGVFSAIALFALIFVFLLAKFGPMLFTSMHDALSFLSSFQSYGNKDLALQKDYYYYAHYFVFPILIFLILIFVMRKIVMQKSGNEKEQSSFAVLLFFILFYYANFQRGLVRHNLIEQWDTALSSFCFFILPSGILLFIKNKNEITRSFIFLATSTLLILAYRFTTPDFSGSNSSQLFIKSTEHNIVPPMVDYKIDRTPNATSFYKNFCGELDDFMKKNFSDTATFIDFSNTSMLYYYLHRVTPNYFNQMPNTSHNDYLQKRFLEELKNYSAPIVVHSSYPYSWFDYVDGVPNSLRHYLISEYIEQNYKPAFIINNKCIWTEKKLQLQNNRREIFSMNSFSHSQLRGITFSDSVHFVSTSSSPLLTCSFNDTLPALNHNKKYYLLFNFSSSSAGTMEIQFVYNKVSAEEKTKMNVTSGNNLAFAILNSFGPRLTDVNIFLPENTSFTFQNLKIVEADYIDDFYSSQPEEFSLGYIPYVWGQFDKNSPAEKLITQQNIVSDTTSVANENEKRFSFNAVQKKVGGTYFFIKAKNNSDKPVDVILNYGEGNSKSGGFVFTMPNGADEKNYLVRVSSQHGWWIRENNWLSFYPMGGSITLCSVKISSGN